jgi:hypothetical protein
MASAVRLGASAHPCSRRIALCWEAGYSGPKGGLNEIMQSHPDGGVFVLSLFHSEESRTWTTSPVGIFVPYGGRLISIRRPNFRAELRVHNPLLNFATLGVPTYAVTVLWESATRVGIEPVPYLDGLMRAGLDACLPVLSISLTPHHCQETEHLQDAFRQEGPRGGAGGLDDYRDPPRINRLVPARKAALSPDKWRPIGFQIIRSGCILPPEGEILICGPSTVEDCPLKASQCEAANRIASGRLL